MARFDLCSRPNGKGLFVFKLFWSYVCEQDLRWTDLQFIIYELARITNWIWLFMKFQRIKCLKLNCVLRPLGSHSGCFVGTTGI